MYHTKDVSNQVHYNSDHEIKSYSCSNSTTKMSKKKKKYKSGQGFQIGAKRFQTWGEITNRGKGDSKWGRERS